MSFGAQPYRPEPTDRQKVISERLAEKVKEETGLVVDQELARAVRWTVLRWSERAMFASEDELEFLTAHARFGRKRARALSLLAEAEVEISQWYNDEDEDEDESDLADYSDDSEDEAEDDDAVFGDKKVTADFQ